MNTANSPMNSTLQMNSCSATSANGGMARPAPPWPAGAAIEQAEAVRTPAQASAADKAAGAEREIYYESKAKRFWTRNRRGNWVQLSEANLKRALRQEGVPGRCQSDGSASALDRILTEAVLARDVEYAGPLAGRGEGVYEMEGKRILVTESPQLIEPEPGKFETLWEFLRGLLGGDKGPGNQLPYLLGWLKVALRSLAMGQIRPGQALVLAGERDCGKTLLVSLIGLLFGGRSAKPYQYMTGATNFNADCFEGELLVVDDEQASTDARSRRLFAAKIKEMLFGGKQRCHGKNRQAVMLDPFWRLVICVNIDPESLMVLPSLDDSVKDKLMILRASRRRMPMPTQTPEQREAFWETLTRELPAFAHFILTQWNIQAEISSDRCGVCEYHHPAILEAIDEVSAEMRLQRLIDLQIFSGESPGVWEGSAEELERELSNGRYASEVRRLLNFNNACGVFLSRLAAKANPRVIRRRVTDRRLWRIEPAEPRRVWQDAR
jgi:hypothetical protein